MSTATYRGVTYDTEIRKEEMISNWLPIIRKQIEKQNKLKEAQYHMATLGWSKGGLTSSLFLYRLIGEIDIYGQRKSKINFEKHGVLD